MSKVGQNHIYGVYTAFLAGKWPSIRTYTPYIHTVLANQQREVMRGVACCSTEQQPKQSVACLLRCNNRNGSFPLLFLSHAAILCTWFYLLPLLVMYDKPSLSPFFYFL